MKGPEKHANRLIQKLKINTAPVDVENIAKWLGAKVVFSALDDSHCGMIYMQGNKVVIGVNSLHPENRQRFTIAHELGHFVMHKNQIEGNIHVDQTFSEKLNRDGKSSLGEDLKEIQANRFAAELLIPTKLLLKETKNKRIDIEDDDFIQKLAEKFQVSSQSMSIKLFNTFYDDYVD